MKRTRCSAVMVVVIWVAWFVSLAPRAHAQQEGIFADFTTSMGSFSCRLDPVHAPKATANFIGLATGGRAWVEEKTGKAVTNAFFDGLRFHRVVAGFVIQSGSPNGLGTDGPGYSFPDQFDASVRHDSAGVLSMANTGTNSNGAQFFVTVASTPWLNDVHTIFGRVVSRQEVVDAINQVATDPSEAPLVEVRIESVSIRRVGVEAAGFDIHGQDLPVVSRVPLGIVGGSGEVTLALPDSEFAGHYLLTSTNLGSWESTFLGIGVGQQVSKSFTIPIDAPTRFFGLTRVQYASSIFAPPQLDGLRLRLDFNEGAGTITIDFDALGGGTYTYTEGVSGTVSLYSWSQQPYRGFLTPILFSDLVPMTLDLIFASETTGSFSGVAFLTPAVAVSGTFSLLPF